MFEGPPGLRPKDGGIDRGCPRASKIAPQVLDDDSGAIAEYHKGEDTAFNLLVGQVKKATRGEANRIGSWKAPGAGRGET